MNNVVYLRNLLTFKPLNSPVEGMLNDLLQEVPIEFPTVLPTWKLGIEVEVEKTQNVYITTKTNKIWKQKEDASLKIYGKEFVSCPIKAKYAEAALKTLLNDLMVGNAEFTPRCSIHIHINARSLTLDQIKSILYIYVSVEDLLFNFVGEQRRKSIFCVPLKETQDLYFINKYIEHPTLINWLKYTALNLLPMWKPHMGTLEFRHLHGTYNIEKILTWINIILCIVRFAKKRPHKTLVSDIYKLNTNSSYLAWLGSIFNEDIYPHLLSVDLDKRIEHSVKQLKILHNLENSITLDKSSIDSQLDILLNNNIKKIYEMTKKTTKRKFIFNPSELAEAVSPEPPLEPIPLVSPPDIPPMVWSLDTATSTANTTVLTNPVIYSE